MMACGIYWILQPTDIENVSFLDHREAGRRRLKLLGGGDTALKRLMISKWLVGFGIALAVLITYFLG